MWNQYCQLMRIASKKIILIIFVIFLHLISVNIIMSSPDALPPFQDLKRAIKSATRQPIDIHGVPTTQINVAKLGIRKRHIGHSTGAGAGAGVLHLL